VVRRGSLKDLIPLGNPPSIKAASAQLTLWGREKGKGKKKKKRR
jgi:hypothetical protein